MLSAAVYTTLMIPCDERHEYQTACVEMLRQAILDIEQNFVRILEQAKLSREQLDEIDHVKAQRVAQQQLAQKFEEVARRKELCKEKQTSIKAAGFKVSKTEYALAKAAAEAGGVVEEKQVYDLLFSDHLEPLKNGTGNGPKHLEALMPTCMTLKLDQSFFAVLPKVANKTVKSRGSFDNMCIAELEREFRALLSQLGEKLSVYEQVRKDREADVVTSRAFSEAAHKANAAAASSLEAAEKEIKRCEAAVSAANRAKVGAAAAVKRADDASVDANDCLISFRNGPLIAFLTLAERAVEEAPTPRKPAPLMQIATPCRQLVPVISC